MAWAIVNNNAVLNIVVSQTGEGFTSIPDGTQIGATWDGVQWVPPAPTVQPNIVYVTDFWLRFTTSERIGINGSADPSVQDLVSTLRLFTQIDLRSQLMVDGVSYLVFAGLITAERAAEVLA
jgi:hypothetical protein